MLVGGGARQNLEEDHIASPKRRLSQHVWTSEVSTVPQQHERLKIWLQT